MKSPWRLLNAALAGLEGVDTSCNQCVNTVGGEAGKQAPTAM